MGVVAVRSHRGAAAAFMLASVLCYSFVPLLVVMGGVEPPFAFNALYRLGAGLGGLVFLLLACRPVLLDPGARSLLWSRARRRDFPLLCLPYFGYTAFAWSARLVEVSLTTVIVESWPLFYLPLAERLMRHQGRYLRATPLRMLPVLLGFLGFVLVVSSHAGGIGRLHTLGLLPLLGILLALLGALSSTSSSYNVLWATRLRLELRALAPGLGEYRLELFGMMLAFTLGSLASAGLNLLGEAALLGWRFPPLPSLREFLLVGLVGGLLLDLLGTLGQRTAVYRAVNLAVNALAFAIPVFSLLWIWLFWRVGVARPGLLLAGALVILFSNPLVALGDRVLPWLAAHRPSWGRPL